jgi:hypothetical protein
MFKFYADKDQGPWVVLVQRHEMQRGDGRKDLAYETDWRTKAVGDTNSTGGCEYLALAGLVGVDALEGGDKLGEECCDYTGNVHKRSFFTKRHSGPKGGCQTNYFG